MTKADPWMPVHYIVVKRIPLTQYIFEYLGLSPSFPFSFSLASFLLAFFLPPPMPLCFIT